jgi:hypothetical protein
MVDAAASWSTWLDVPSPPHADAVTAVAAGRRRPTDRRGRVVTRVRRPASRARPASRPRLASLVLAGRRPGRWRRRRAARTRLAPHATAPMAATTAAERGGGRRRQLLGEDHDRWSGRPVDAHPVPRQPASVEDDAIRVNLLSRAGGAARSAASSRDDVRAMWKHGLLRRRHGRRATISRRRRRGAHLPRWPRSRRCAKVLGVRQRRARAREDQRRASTSNSTRSLDIAKIKRQPRQAIAKTCTSRRASTWPASTYEVKHGINESRGRRLLQRRREGQGPDPRRRVHRQPRRWPTTSCARSIATQSGAARCRSSTDSGTYNQEAFERDLLHRQRPTTGTGLRRRQGRHAAAAAVARQALHVPGHPDRPRGRSTPWPSVDFRGDLIGDRSVAPRQEAPPDRGRDHLA